MKSFKIFIIGFVVLQSCQAAQVEKSQAELDKELFSAIDMAERSQVIAALQSHANPNACDDKGETPLMKAVRGMGSAVGLLIDHGANPYAVDSQGHAMDHFIEEGERVFGGHGFRSETLRKSIMRKMKEDRYINAFLPDVLEDVVIEYCEGSMYWEKRYDDVSKSLSRINKETTDFDIYCLVEFITFPSLLNLDATKQVDTPSIRQMIESAAKKYESDSGKHPSEAFPNWQKLEECMEKMPKAKRIIG